MNPAKEIIAFSEKNLETFVVSVAGLLNRIFLNL